jgi:high-affinity nickel-transport protein
MVRNAYRWLLARVRGHEHHTVSHVDQYGPRTAFGIGLIHGIGAETGTQVLVIATAVGAGSRPAGVAALLAFVVGLLISNSVVIIATATGFVGASKRQWLYVGAGALAATFSLVLGVMFVFGEEGLLPSLDPYFRWIGGPE